MKNVFLWVVTLLGAALLAACGEETPEPTPTLQPTPTVITVHLASELSPMRSAIAACTAEIGDIGVLVFEAAEPAWPAGGGSVTLRIGFPESFPGQANLLGQEDILVVTGMEAPDMTEAQTRAFFSGGAGSDSGVSVWIPLPETQSRLLLDVWMRGAPYSPDAFISPGPGQLLEILKNESGSIGVLPSRWVAQDLQVLFSLGDAPVLALTQDEPVGKLRKLIGCLQGENAGD